MPFYEGDTVFTPKGEATVIAWDHTFRVKYKGKSMASGYKWEETYGDYSLWQVGEKVFTSKESQDAHTIDDEVSK